MSGAWPPPAPSVWKVADRAALEGGDGVLDEARFVERVGVDRHLHVVASATSRQLSIAAGVVPQSSCSFRPNAPASTCSSSAAGRLALPLPMKPRFIGNASAACSIAWMCHGPGVQVVAKVPVAGPVPPPSIVVTPLASASSICCGQMKWMWVSMPPAVTIMPSPAMISVPGPMTMSTPGCTSGLPALPIAGDAAGLDADVGLDDAPVVDDQRVGDHGVGDLGRDALALRPCRRGSSCRRRTSLPRRSRRRAACSRPRPR